MQTNHEKAQQLLAQAQTLAAQGAVLRSQARSLWREAARIVFGSPLTEEPVEELEEEAEVARETPQTLARRDPAQSYRGQLRKAALTALEKLGRPATSAEILDFVTQNGLLPPSKHETRKAIGKQLYEALAHACPVIRLPDGHWRLRGRPLITATPKKRRQARPPGYYADMLREVLVQATQPLTVRDIVEKLRLARKVHFTHSSRTLVEHRVRYALETMSGVTRLEAQVSAEHCGPAPKYAYKLAHEPS